MYIMCSVIIISIIIGSASSNSGVHFIEKKSSNITLSDVRKIYREEWLNSFVSALIVLIS